VLALSVLVVAFAPAASAAIPDSLKTSCSSRSPAPGYSFELCDDGAPPTAGVTPNAGGVNAVLVPAKYDGWEGLPPKAADAANVPGADADGNIALDVDISIPSLPAPTGGYPLIAMMHGCCAGTKTDWEASSFESSGEKWHYNNAWFAARGYVVVNYTARGFRKGPQGSTGETQLDSRRYEINDFQDLVGQIADDPSFNVNPQKIIPTGGSYGGGFAWLAFTDPIWKSPGGKDMKLVAAAPRYGWTDIVYSLVPNGKHFLTPDRLPAFDGSDTISPLGFPKKSINTILFATGLSGTTFPGYITDAFVCLLSGQPFETNPICTSTINQTLPSFIEDRSAYYQSEFFAKVASDPRYRTPVFNAATLSDPLFTPVENLRMSNRLQSLVPNYPIQQYFGDYEHFVQNKVKEWGDICTGVIRHTCVFAEYPGGDVNGAPPNRVRIGVTTRLNRFIDHYAQPPGNPGQPQPAFDVTASLQICPPNASPDQPADEPGETFTADRFDHLTFGTLRLSLTETQTTMNGVAPNPHAVEADPLTNFLTNKGVCPVSTGPAGPGVAVYESAPLDKQATMIGGSLVSIDYSATTAEGLQLNSRLYDVFPDGRAVMVDRGPRRVDEPSGTVTYQLHGNAWRFPAGHRIRIEISQDDDPFIASSITPSSATITAVRLRIPVREQQPPVREDFENASKFCKALRAFMGDDAFGWAFGSNKNGRNAHGKCVSSNGRLP
jgi:hypothetical protein